jgi:UDP-GlcNAc:undecaprenyl-phosphate GlcNAc-1-phosphate transferase
MTRRFFARRSIFSADRSHVHHRLLDLGLTHRRAVVIIYAMSIVLTLAAIGLALGRSWEVGFAILAASTVVIIIVRLAGYLEAVPFVRKQNAASGQDTELLRGALVMLSSQLAESSGERDALAALETLRAAADLAAIELVHRETGQVLHSWGKADDEERQLLSTRYLLGPETVAVADIQYRWESELETVPPQIDALLRLSADMVVACLLRAKSPLVTRAMPQEASAPSESAVVIGAASAKL